MFIFFATLLLIITDWFLSHYSTFIFKNTPYEYIRLSVFTSYLLSFQYIPFVILRVTEQIKYFGIISSLSFLLQTCFTMIYIVGFKMGVEGILIGQLSNAVIWFLYWIIWMFRRWKKCFAINILEEFKYSIFYIPAILLEQIAKVYDKIILNRFISPHDLGIYSQGQRIGAAYDQINSSIKSAFFPIIYTMDADETNLEHELPKLSSLYFLILLYFIFLLNGAAVILVETFGRGMYDEVLKYVYIFILVSFIRSQDLVWGIGFDLAKRSDIFMMISLSMSTLSIILMSCLVPKFGLIGALTVLAFFAFVRSSILIYKGHKLYKRHFPFKYICTLIFVTGIFFIIFKNINMQSFVVAIELIKIAAISLVFWGLYKYTVYYFNKFEKQTSSER